MFQWIQGRGGRKSSGWRDFSTPGIPGSQRDSGAVFHVGGKLGRAAPSVLRLQSRAGMGFSRRIPGFPSSCPFSWGLFASRWESCCGSYPLSRSRWIFPSVEHEVKLHGSKWHPWIFSFPDQSCSFCVGKTGKFHPIPWVFPSFFPPLPGSPAIPGFPLCAKAEGSAWSGRVALWDPRILWDSGILWDLGILQDTWTQRGPGMEAPGSGNAPSGAAFPG